MATDVLLISEARIATVQLLEQLLDFLADTTPLTTRSRLLTEVVPEDFVSGTFPLIVRSCNSDALSLTRALRKHGVDYGFYLDDNFWLLDPTTELGKYYSSRPHRQQLDEIVREASIVIAATPLLMEYVRPKNPRVIQLDSFFDFSLIPEVPRSVAGTRIRCGFAASAGRIQDLLPIVGEVVDVLNENESFDFEIIGVDPSEGPQHPRISYYPYQPSYREYVDFQRSRRWDFGLAPLGDAPSNLYKTDNKFREYAAHGIAGIYQEAAPYQLVRDGETGLLAGGARSWGDAIRQYISDPDLRARVRSSARSDAERRCALENVAGQWQHFFESAPALELTPNDHQRLNRTLRQRASRAARFGMRLRLLSIYGWSRVRQDGLVPTVGRTLRYLRRRADR
jgi:hypothetical protein